MTKLFFKNARNLEISRGSRLHQRNRLDLKQFRINAPARSNLGIARKSRMTIKTDLDDTISMLVTNWAAHPGNGITLETTALRVMCNTSAGRRKAMKFAPARTPDQFRARNRSPAAIFHEISSHATIALTNTNLWSTRSASPVGRLL